MQWKRVGVITLSVVLVAVPAYSIPVVDPAALAQRITMMVNQVSIITNQLTQIQQFSDKLTEMRDQVQHLKDKGMGAYHALTSPFTSLISAKNELVGTGMSWVGQFQGTAGRDRQHLQGSVRWRVRSGRMGWPAPDSRYCHGDRPGRYLRQPAGRGRQPRRRPFPAATGIGRPPAGAGSRLGRLGRRTDRIPEGYPGIARQGAEPNGKVRYRPGPGHHHGHSHSGRADGRAGAASRPTRAPARPGRAMSGSWPAGRNWSDGPLCSGSPSKTSRTLRN